MIDLEKYKINIKSNIREALKTIDTCGVGFGVVVDEHDFVIGVITDGDFRRAVLKGVNLNGNVLEIANTKFKHLNLGYKLQNAISMFSKGTIEHLPVLNNNKLEKIITERDIYIEKQTKKSYPKIDVPVVIMAGGKGTRMEPITNILPKPLIPIGDKTMIEVIMEEYAKYGIDNFHISVNYKANMIKAYFEYSEKRYNINYINEVKPLGTAGALKYLQGILNTPFFVSNCDIIIKDDYCKIYDFHKKQDFILSVITSLQHLKIPYGVCEIDERGCLTKIKEKPEYDFLVNTGMYILNPEALNYIPTDTFFNITDLIKELLINGKKVGVYPVSEKSYIDVGQWAEYKRAIGILTT